MCFVCSFQFFLLTAGHHGSAQEFYNEKDNKALAVDQLETRAVVTTLTDDNATLAQTLEEERRRTEAKILLSKKPL